MKKLLLLLVIVVGLWSCSNKSWNGQGHWKGGTFTVNDTIKIENREIVVATNETKDSAMYFIRYDVIVNNITCYQSYQPATNTKEQIIDSLELGYNKWLLLPTKPPIIRQYPIKKQEEKSPRDYRQV